MKAATKYPDSLYAIGAERPLESVEEVVEAVVEFATGKRRPPLWTRFRYSMDPSEKGQLVRYEFPDGDEVDGKIEWHSISESEARTIATQQLKDEREEALHSLNTVLRSSERMELHRKLLVETSSRYQQKVSMHMVYVSRDDGTIKVSFCASGSRSSKAWTFFALSALVADYAGILSRFSYCHLPGCQNVFLNKPQAGPGRPRSKYCCDKHRDEAHNADAAERQRRSRERRRQAAKKKAPRRQK